MLTYDCADKSVRTASGRVLATSDNLTAVSVAFPGAVIRVKNIKSII